MIIHDYRFAVEHHCKYHCAGQAILGTTLSLYEPSDQPQIVKKTNVNRRGRFFQKLK